MSGNTDEKNNKNLAKVGDFLSMCFPDCDFCLIVRKEEGNFMFGNIQPDEMVKMINEILLEKEYYDSLPDEEPPTNHGIM